MEKQHYNNDSKIQAELEEADQAQYGFRFRTEDEKLREDIFRSAKDKLSIFTDMLCREKMFKNTRVNSGTL
jgi:hypothetical protein